MTCSNLSPLLVLTPVLLAVKQLNRDVLPTLYFPAKMILYRLGAAIVRMYIHVHMYCMRRAPPPATNLNQKVSGWSLALGMRNVVSVRDTFVQ